MIKENWFKIIVLVALITVVIFISNYHEKKYSTEKRLQIFRICIDTVDNDVLKNYQALQVNIELCEKMSNKFK